jgi:hypothetical protein
MIPATAAMSTGAQNAYRDKTKYRAFDPKPAATSVGSDWGCLLFSHDEISQ